MEFFENTPVELINKVRSVAEDADEIHEVEDVRTKVPSSAFKVTFSQIREFMFLQPKIQADATQTKQEIEQQIFVLSRNCFLIWKRLFMYCQAESLSTPGVIDVKPIGNGLFFGRLRLTAVRFSAHMYPNTWSFLDNMVYNTAFSVRYDGTTKYGTQEEFTNAIVQRLTDNNADWILPNIKDCPTKTQLLTYVTELMSQPAIKTEFLTFTQLIITPENIIRWIERPFFGEILIKTTGLIKAENIQFDPRHDLRWADATTVTSANDACIRHFTMTLRFLNSSLKRTRRLFKEEEEANKKQHTAQEQERNIPSKLTYPRILLDD